VDLSDEILKKAEAEVSKNIRFASLFSKPAPALTRKASKRLLLTDGAEGRRPCDSYRERHRELGTSREASTRSSKRRASGNLFRRQYLVHLPSPRSAPPPSAGQCGGVHFMNPPT